jgi:hypothetical protein
MNTNIHIKTAQAAEVAGVGYEGFRSWLKRGLLKDNGILPKFYAADAPAEVSDAKRWRWSAFGFVDLCSFRLTKLLLDAGLSWEIVSPVVSDDAVWRSHRSDQPDQRFLAVFPRTLQYTLYSAETLADDLNRGIIKSSWMTVMDLHQIRQDVVCRVRAVALRTLAGDVKRTSHFFARSGRDMLSPDETVAHQHKIEALADEIAALATTAEQGAGSYQQFETILTQLHGLGKFPDSADVSAVAHAFAD